MSNFSSKMLFILEVLSRSTTKQNVDKGNEVKDILD